MCDRVVQRHDQRRVRRPRLGPVPDRCSDSRGRRRCSRPDCAGVALDSLRVRALTVRLTCPQNLSPCSSATAEPGVPSGRRVPSAGILLKPSDGPERCCLFSKRATESLGLITATGLSPRGQRAGCSWRSLGGRRHRQRLQSRPEATDAPTHASRSTAAETSSGRGNRRRPRRGRGQPADARSATSGFRRAHCSTWLNIAERACSELCAFTARVIFARAVGMLRA